MWDIRAKLIEDQRLVVRLALFAAIAATEETGPGVSVDQPARGRSATGHVPHRPARRLAFLDRLLTGHAHPAH